MDDRATRRQQYVAGTIDDDALGSTGSRPRPPGRNARLSHPGIDGRFPRDLDLGGIHVGGEQNQGLQPGRGIAPRLPWENSAILGVIANGWSAQYRQSSSAGATQPGQRAVERVRCSGLLGASDEDRASVAMFYQWLSGGQGGDPYHRCQPDRRQPRQGDAPMRRSTEPDSADGVSRSAAPSCTWLG